MVIRNNPLLKGLAFAVACCMVAGIAVLGAAIWLNGTAVMYGDDWNSLYEVQRLFRQDISKIYTYLRISTEEAEERPVSEWEQAMKEEYGAYLKAENTNLRWELTDQDGNVLQGNVDQKPSVVGPYSASDYVQDWTDASTIHLWVEDELKVSDAYRTAIETGRLLHSQLNLILVIMILMGTVLVICLAFLGAGAGYQVKTGEVVLNWFHKIPGDILFLALFLGSLWVVDRYLSFLVRLANYYTGAFWTFGRILVATGLVAGLAAIMPVAAFTTFVARCRSHTFWRNTLIWRVCSVGWKIVCRMARYLQKVWKQMWEGLMMVPLVWRTIAAYCCYGVFSLFVMSSWRYYDFLLPSWGLLTALLALWHIRWVVQWTRIRQGTREIIGGNRKYVIQSAGMFPDLREHADTLNNLSQVITQAVEDQTNSERFKAELITNVSHDLKTPLTSIINYVDLLKKEPIDNPRVQEYLEVLDRKSQRLKKLTEDLVEASKASTGNLTVNPERLDFVLLIDQAMAEWVERLEASQLTLVRTLPELPVWVHADGRHLWRVLDNLLSNCAKYALAGTRVYVSLQCDAQAVLTVKNISRDPLDVPAERLMERFVRGDESRTEAGSGLGLSIAQSLTEIQGGTFRLDIDGDLFKAIVTLPYDVPSVLPN